jgi:nucleoside-diphosphate-sugar epimerase
MILKLNRISPNKIRLIYDFILASISVLFTALFSFYFNNIEIKQIESMFSIPFMLTMIMYVFGLYGRHRFSNYFVKSIYIFVSIFITSFAVLLFGSTKILPQLFLCAFITAQFLILPRLIFGFSNEAKGVLRQIVNYNGPIVVTGGAGYIGSHVVFKLLKKGYSVRVIDSLMFGSNIMNEFISNPKFELITGDVSNITVLTRALNGASAVIHLSGLVGDPACAFDDSFTRHSNIISTKLIKQLSHSLGIHRFIFASSCSVYGISDKELNENDVLNPISLYAKTKIDSENEILSDIPDDFIVTVLRFATVFGHSRRARFDLVANLFAAQAIIDEKITVVGANQWRPFIHVEDLANAIILTLEAKSKLIQGQILNVGDAKLNMTLLSLSEIVKDCAAKYNKLVKVNILDSNISDFRNYNVSFSKINKLLGFSATRTMSDGLDEIMKKIISKEYLNYRDDIYSNFLTTKKFSKKFHDPMQRVNLYSTLEEI